jgi:hypothetical protein
MLNKKTLDMVSETVDQLAENVHKMTGTRIGISYFMFLDDESSNAIAQEKGGLICGASVKGLSPEEISLGYMQCAEGLGKFLGSSTEEI